jgi:phosphate transport system permease protein
LTGLATLLILALLVVIVGNILWHGLGGLSWRFLSTSGGSGMFDKTQAGVLPMIVGTAARVILMTLFVIPMGVITAIYLTEYAGSNSLLNRVIRGAVNNLAGVPSIIFGLFGLGFFIHFLGTGLDHVATEGAAPRWGRPGLLWASLTMAVMTMPVVIVATEESLRAIPTGLREASLALGATRLQTILHVVLPQAVPGILTGAILSVGRAAGEVAPLLFTGAAFYKPGLPTALTEQFMDLGYHVFILSTQSANTEQTRPVLYATVLVLLGLTIALNLTAVLIRARMRRQPRLIP